MQSLSVKNTKFQKQYREWSYSWHQRRLSEISQRKQNNLSIDLSIIETCRRNKYFNSKRKEIEKQENILYQNRKLLTKIANVKSSFYKSSSRHSILSKGSKQSDRSIQQKKQNIQIVKQNHEIRQKLSQMCIKSINIVAENQHLDQYNLEDQVKIPLESQQLIQMVIQKISQIKLKSIPSPRNRDYSSDYTGITKMFPKISLRYYNILPRGRQNKQT